MSADVVLTPLMPNDAQLMFQWLNDVELSYLNGPYRPTDGMTFGPWYNGIGKDQTKVFFAIRPAADERFAGYVVISSIHAVFRSAELGIIIGAEADRSRGWGQQALALALKFCWNDLNLNRVSLMIYGDNPRAVGAYAKTGFQHEGVLRQAAFIGGKYVDITVMAALRENH
jgi:RimJ/RimL family protein N-acetyltransferase